MRILNSGRLRLALTCSTAIGLAALPFAAVAQDLPQQSGAADSADSGSDTIVVTGSRILRRDFESNSPILTVNEDVLEASSTASIESNLNRLPQFTPDKTPEQGGDIQPTATNTPGSATVSLRSLGANRTLVLLDGRRATPANASMVVDINSIPAAAIDRVEIITGGASATYGADAVGGVVNFIMKRDFQGLALDGQAGISQEGDGFEYTLSGIMGANFDDGRGNISLSMSTNAREASYRRDRSWFRDFWRDPTIGGTEFFPDFSGYASLGGNTPSQAAIDSIFGAANNVSTTDRYYFNADGTAFTGFFRSTSPGGVDRFNGDLTGIKWKRTSNGQLAQNFTNELLTLPITRYNVYSQGSYEINDWIGVFARGMFSHTRTDTIQQPSPSVNGWSAIIPADGRDVPDELQTILDSRPDPTAPWQLTYYLDFKDRTSQVNVFTYNLLAGFEGSVPGSDWTWEMFVSQGESQTDAKLEGFASLERFRAVVSAPNWGAGFSAQGNAPFGGFGASSATCTSGFDPFDLDLRITEDCIEAVSADIKTRSTLRQTNAEFNAQGALFDLWAGEVRAAVGASYRENDYEFINDTLSTQGRSFQDQVIGLYPSGNSEGFIKVKEVYGELLIPLLRDAVVQELNLEIGARMSDYNTIGTNYTYKILGDLQLTDWLRARGGYNRAVRAPNIAELFLAPQQTFVFSGNGDVCSTNNTLPFSANPATNPDAAGVLALCRQLMNQVDPTTADFFYGDPANQTVGGTFAFPTLQGNPDVVEETADTWTAGVVVNSPFDGGALSSLRLAVDYYNIKVKDAIGPQSIDVAQQQCFDTAFNPTLSIDSPFCAGINRNAGTGSIGNIITTFFNNGDFKTSGLDVQLDWSTDVGPGRFAINSIFNYLIELKSRELATNPVIDYAGTLGPNQNGLNPGSFRWKMLNTFSYGIGPANVSLMWRHLPSIESITYANNEATTIDGAPSYDLFNLFGSYSVADNVTVRFGVDNLMNKRPPIFERNSSPPPGVLAGGTFASANGSYLYDLQGRRFYLGANFEF